MNTDQQPQVPQAPAISAYSPQQMSRSGSQNNIAHTIKRNIGSSTTSLTAFSLAHQAQPNLQRPTSLLGNGAVSLSPFEYATPVANHGYFDRQAQNSLLKMESGELDFETAYNMINETMDQDPGVQVAVQPTTPNQNFAELSPAEPQDWDQIQNHRRAILEAGLKRRESPLQARSPFNISPHTRKLLNSVNSLTSQYQMNNSGYELLSITESSALEKFLDSVVDDSKLNDLEKLWPSIDPLARSGDSELSLPHLVTEGGGSRRPKVDHIPDLRLQKFDQSDIPDLPSRPIPAGHIVPLSYTASPEPSTGTSPAEQQPVEKKKRGRKKKSEQPGQAAKKPKLEEGSDDQKAKRQILSEEQKKYNHTESEKKRRALIKTAYDTLLETIDVDKCYHLRAQTAETKKEKKGKRGNSRYAVMNYVINEIEWLTTNNAMLKDKLAE